MICAHSGLCVPPAGILLSYVIRQYAESIMRDYLAARPFAAGLLLLYVMRGARKPHIPHKLVAPPQMQMPRGLGGIAHDDENHQRPPAGSDPAGSGAFNGVAPDARPGKQPRNELTYAG